MAKILHIIDMEMNGVTMRFEYTDENSGVDVFTLKDGKYLSNGHYEKDAFFAGLEKYRAAGAEISEHTGTTNA